jgi:hypothetical protein
LLKFKRNWTKFIRVDDVLRQTPEKKLVVEVLASASGFRIISRVPGKTQIVTMHMNEEINGTTNRMISDVGTPSQIVGHDLTARLVLKHGVIDNTRSSITLGREAKTVPAKSLSAPAPVQVITILFWKCLTMHQKRKSKDLSVDWH